ncbi:hypothetical protein N0V86_002528 [Didymella sp. IMI 355093]|nr:hypothetical protein N0V86_002528 [Didymella sp. IMI 355093]
MASYLQKLRPKAKQNDPANFRETVVHNTPKTEETTKPSGPVPSPPAGPTISEPADETGAEPVLDEEDERFLERLAAIASEPEGTPPPLPGRPAVVIDESGHQKVGKDAQEALMDGADKIALPQSPPEKKAFTSYFSNFAVPKFGKKADKTEKEKDTTTKDKKSKAKVTEAERNEMADNLLAAAEKTKTAEEAEVEKETQDLTKILEELNMSAVNNRVFSFSKESEELLQKFTLVLKDVVNGAPHAYDDLEKLFTDYDAQLKKMYGGLPPFLQNFVKSLPAKMTAALGPELLAASAEKPGFDGKQKAAGEGSKSKKSRIPGVPKIPSLKQLVSAQGAVATALRSIVNFLKFRFPALATGTNLIMSLAVMILLFVFWYCHKRGREVRLEKERLAAETASAEASGTSSAVASDDDSVFGDQKRAKTKATSEPVPRVAGEPTEPTIIKDHKEDGKATVADLPDVSQLPEPGKAPENK